MLRALGMALLVGGSLLLGAPEAAAQPGPPGPPGVVELRPDAESAQPAGDLPPQIAAEENLVRVTLPVASLPDCAPLCWWGEPPRPQEGILELVVTLGAAADCSATVERPVQIIVANVPEGGYTVDARIRDGRTPAADPLAVLTLDNLMVAGDPALAEEVALTVRQGDGAGEWREIAADCPGQPTGVGFERPGQPGRLRIE
jgi:hypothetical protein